MMVTVDQARAAIGLAPLGGQRGAFLLDARLLPAGRPLRRRGVYVPAAEARALIELCAWELLDDCPGADEVLLAPPAETFKEGYHAR